MFNCKKVILIFSLLLFLLSSFCLHAAALPLTEETEIVIASYYSSSDTDTVLSVSQVSGTTNTLVTGNDTLAIQNQYIVSFHLKDLGLVAGFSYEFRIRVSGYNGSRVAQVLPIFYKYGSDGNLEALSDLAPFTTSGTFSYQIPNDTIAFGFVVQGYKASGASHFQFIMGQMTITPVSSADVGNWDGSSNPELSEPDMSEMLDNVDEINNSLDSIINEGFPSVSGAVINFAKFFSGIWDILHAYLPEITFVISLSLLLGLSAVIMRLFRGKGGDG